MTSWVRLWSDMPTDPKWRAIARRSGAHVTQVIAVWTMMMTHAGRETCRGTLDGWSDEDAAAALDMDEEQVAAIRMAMQGKVLEGNTLSGWEKRQPKREDDSRKRVTEWRQRQKERDVTHGNAHVTAGDAPEAEADTDIGSSLRSEPAAQKRARASRLPSDWVPDDQHIEAAVSVGLPVTLVDREAGRFRDYWLAKAGKDGAKLDWLATWRNWCRTAVDRLPQPRGPNASPSQDRRSVAERSHDNLMAAFARHAGAHVDERMVEEPDSAASPDDWRAGMDLLPYR